MAEKIEFNLSVSKDDLNAALSSATNEAKKTEKAIFRLSDAFSDASSELSKIKTSFIGNLGANAVTSAFSSLSSAISFTVQQAREFSRSIAEVNSILPKNAKLTKDQIDLFIQLSSLYGKSTQSEAKAFYEIVSGGVEDTATAFKILKQANEAATAGLTDVNVAAKTLTSTFNVFSQQGATVNQITDALFQAVKDGQTTFEELSGTLGRVSSIASSAGLNINDVAGTIAFLTKSGFTSDQAITGLRATIASIIKPSKEAADEANRLGLVFSPAGIAKAGGFVKFLDQVRVATNGSSTSIAKLFGDVNAINTVSAIASKNFEDFSKTIDSNTKSIGATASAAKELKGSLDFQLGQTEQSFKNIGTALAVNLLPYLQTAIKGFQAITGLGQVNVQLDENRKKLSDLGLEYNKISDALNQLKNSSGGSDRQLQESIKIVGTVSQGEARLNSILKERQSIREALANQKPIDIKPVDPVVDPQAEAESQRLRTETFNQLALARSDFDAAEQERKLLSIEQGTIEGQAELDRLLELERKKIDAKYAAEEEKSKLIQDSVAKEQAIRATAIKKENDFANAAITIQQRKTTAQNKLEQQSLQTKLDYLNAFGNLASAIAKDGSKEQFYIQKAAAIAQSIVATQLAATQALTVVPPERGIALAATVKTIGAINTAAIAATAIKGFADGGIIGQGATMGGDNRLATVRDGEMVLNAQQQEKLFNMITSGNMAGGDIVIQINEREIARAVRNQLNSGYKLA